MSDDDDYFTDDICFDDQTLAILDREEQKYHANTAGPTSKRQRTDNGWKAGIGANVALPEISLDFGGSYDVRRAAMNSLNTAANLLSASSRSPAELYTNSALTTSEARSVQAVTTTLSDAPRPHVASASTMLFNASANALTIQLQELQQKLEQVSYLINQPLHVVKIYQMSEENKRMQTALHDAKNAKLAKEGEQHEQESAIRPPQSVRHKRVSRDNSFTASATPLRLHRPGQQNDLFNPHTVDKRRNTSTPALASSPAKNRNTLPGFENAFGDTTPLPPSRRGPNPGTSRHNFEGFSQQDGFSPTMPRHSIASIETHIGVDDPTDDSFMESAQVDADRDVDMPFGTPEAKHEEQDLDDIVHALEPPDWRVEDHIDAHPPAMPDNDDTITFRSPNYLYAGY
ncbi:hypothetical protein H0H93_004638 [Arthromyces matolae]|nr:hypothetical protein H0H93_004638 [Arthromyces matolae]